MADFSDTTDFAPLPFELDGSYDWLRQMPEHSSTSMAFTADATNRLYQAAKEAGLKLPDEVTHFFDDPSLALRIRSTTDCFVNPWESFVICKEVKLIQFLSDSQGACHWYLCFANPSNQVSVLWSYHFDADDYDPEIETLDLSDFVVVGESFEAFICRFWLDNEIGFGDTPANIDAAVLKHYPTM